MCCDTLNASKSDSNTQNASLYALAAGTENRSKWQSLSASKSNSNAHDAISEDSKLIQDQLNSVRSLGHIKTLPVKIQLKLPHVKKLLADA